jgi:hypothetical protein
MAKILGLAVLALTISACTTARPIELPGGGQGFMIACNGIQNTMNDCYTKAAEVCCPVGYDIVSATDESVPVLNHYARTLTVRCR